MHVILQAFREEVNSQHVKATLITRQLTQVLQVQLGESQSAKVVAVLLMYPHIQLAVQIRRRHVMLVLKQLAHNEEELLSIPVKIGCLVSAPQHITDKRHLQCVQLPRLNPFVSFPQQAVSDGSKQTAAAQM